MALFTAAYASEAVSLMQIGRFRCNLFLFHLSMSSIVSSELLEKVLVQRHAATALATPSTVRQTQPPHPRNVKNRALHGERAHSDGYALNAIAVVQITLKKQTTNFRPADKYE